ncbi:hypothetical protein [Sphingomonas morindae]|uniref:LPXTG cell wall anchor domain-containing protein n=1 Tax=Sphingomonas morindae TaxID=1541170 RepID=A0ABY4XBR9_9SPHN|nr:hypothetical protein [Sphingomonas morindae]USI74409.1 hypothetical protein LHA26_08150 [Sphingomonas morindae]
MTDDTAETDAAAASPRRARARAAIAGGRDLGRRAAIAVTRAATDNSALTALALGAAVAAAGWLLVGRRGRDRRDP